MLQGSNLVVPEVDIDTLKIDQNRQKEILLKFCWQIYWVKEFFQVFVQVILIYTATSLSGHHGIMIYSL